MIPGNLIWKIVTIILVFLAHSCSKEKLLNFSLLILSINFKDDDCLLKALDNKEASRIQDYKGWHIGLYCAQGLRKEASSKAILNKELRNLRDKNDISMMEMLLWKRDKGMEEIYQEAKDLMEKENNENFNDIENDVMEN